MKATKKIIAVVLCLLMLFPCVQMISFAEPVSTMNNNISRATDIPTTTSLKKILTK